jgi:hypothetical protein
MDKANKKQLKTQWRSQQRQAARAALPLPVAELKALFGVLGAELPQHGCDRSRRLTVAWLTSRGHDVERVSEWLDTQGGFCDCEVLANVEEHVDEAMKQ